MRFTVSGSRWIALGVAGVLLVSLLGRGVRSNRGGGAPSCTDSAAATADGAVRIVASEFCFEPIDLTLPASRPTTVVLENRGDAEHDFVVPGLGVHLLAAPGKTARTTVVAAAPGRYQALCSLPGHEQTGMAATVIVT